MARQAMPEFQDKSSVIILCDSWYVKNPLTVLVDEYENLDLIGSARMDTAIYDLPSPRPGKGGIPQNIGKSFLSWKTLRSPTKK